MPTLFDPDDLAQCGDTEPHAAHYCPGLEPDEDHAPRVYAGDRREVSFIVKHLPATGVLLLPGDRPDEEPLHAQQPDIVDSLTDPWTEKPPYLMLELALRKVRDDLQNIMVTRADMTRYIDRVLANDLTEGEQEPAEQPDADTVTLCNARHPLLPLARCTAPAQHVTHDSPHNAWYDDGKAATSIIWEVS